MHRCGRNSKAQCCLRSCPELSVVLFPLSYHVPRYADTNVLSLTEMLCGVDYCRLYTETGCPDGINGNESPTLFDHYYNLDSLEGHTVDGGEVADLSALYNNVGSVYCWFFPHFA